MKLHKSAIYLAAADIPDKIYDLADSNTIILQELAETSFIKSYDNELTAQLRQEITLENVICNLIEFDVCSKSPENNLTNFSRLSKSSSVLNYNVFLNSRNSSQLLTRAERSSSDEVSSESNTTKNKKTTRKVSKISDFYLSNQILTNLEKYTKKKKSKLVHKKHYQMKKMNRIEIDSDFYLAPLDHEYKDYVRQKKEIREKLHDHWKIELNTHQKDKILKINNDVFNSEQQWMTICNKNKEEEKVENSLIDTFTANIEDPNREKMDSYKVNSEIGTLIAQKLLKGEKIRVGRNGTLTGVDGVERGQTFVKLFETFKLPPSGSILSWDDQVAKQDIKIMQPKVAVTDIQKKPKMERNLIVKKLNEEEEFKPVIKKQSQVASPPMSASLSPIKQPIRTDKSLSMQTLTTTNVTQPRPAVEIVGTNTVGHPFQQHLKHSHKSDSTSSLSKTNIASNATATNNNNKNNDWSLDFTVVKQHINTLSSNHNKTSSAKVAMNNLSEKNYLQIIDNLTSRYTSSVERTKLSNEINATNANTSSSKKVINKLNKKDHKDKVLEFINDLGLKSTETKRRKGTSSASFKSQSSNNLNTNHNQKELTPITLTNNNKENKLDNAKTNESNSMSNINNNNTANINDNKNSQNSFSSPRTYSSFSQANTFKLNPSEKSLKSKASITGLNNLSTTSSSNKNNNTKATLKASVSTTTLVRRRKLFKGAEPSTYFNIVKPLEPKSRLPDVTSSFKTLIFDINKSDNNYLTPISPSTSFLTR